MVQLLGRRWPLIPFSWEALVRHLAAALVLAAIHTAAWTELTIRIRPYDQMTIVEFDGNWANLLWVQAQGELLIYFVILGLSAAGAFARTLHRRRRRRAGSSGSWRRPSCTVSELQLRPHFLFNTLNAISALVRGQRNPEAVEMIVRLSDLLHQTLATEPARWIPLQRELELLAGLPRDRGGALLRSPVGCVGDRPGGAGRPGAAIPAAAAGGKRGAPRHRQGRQPRQPGDRARRSGDQVHLEIENSGPPLAPAFGAGGAGGVGLANCRERLFQLFGGAASLALEDRPGGVVARIELPFREAAA